MVNQPLGSLLTSPESRGPSWWERGAEGPGKGWGRAFSLEELDKGRKFLSVTNHTNGNSSLVAKFRNFFVPSVNKFTFYSFII